MLKRIVVILSLICIPFISASAAGPPKIEKVLPHPFQAVISAAMINQSFGAFSDPFMVEDGKTAVIEYISCRINHRGGGSTRAAYQLWVDRDDGSAALMLDSDMSVENGFTPGPPWPTEVSTNFVSACIGADCDSLSDDKYVSITLRATRNASGGSVTDETLDCVITGTTN
jgi:hypothetical protein